MVESPGKILVLGSGAIRIGEAAEFDYSGSQALKALREEGIETVLVNPNIATIQTSYAMADHVYLGPLKPWYVRRVIERETPDAILLGFGGQTALSLGVELWDSGVLREYGVRVLGTPIEGIRRALSRSLFRETMLRRGLPVPPSSGARTVREALEAAEEIGYPVIVRVSFNLGGGGSFTAWSRGDLERWLGRAFAQAGIGEVLVEKYLDGWKEIEFEVVRDYRGTMAAVACLENMDPMGVHTGESIVVAPCQTLSDPEYQAARTASLGVGEAIGLVGEGNVQVALDPYSGSPHYYVIETNPRMSRSSSLASKATGYPLAYIAAKLALGYRLEELLNLVTGRTCACFEPSLDYVVVKIPRWDLSKFDGVEESIGSEMKSIGEVMGIGRSLGEALEKAVRMLDIGLETLGDARDYLGLERVEDALEALRGRRPYWIIYAAAAYQLGATTREIHAATRVDPYFLEQIKNIVELAEHAGDPEYSLELLRQGYPRSRLPPSSRGERPYVRVIDTLAAEWPSASGYTYVSYDSYGHDLPPVEGEKILVLGAGVFRIGVSVEFDWGVVSFTREAEGLGYKSIVLNYNPETVSTDWDMSSRLYFEEVTPDRVEDVYDYERPLGVVAFLGGQISNNIIGELKRRRLRLLGTSAESVDTAEVRARFSRLLEELGIGQPEWRSASSIGEALEAAEEIGYPVIVRPSYVISGSAMRVAYSRGELEALAGSAFRVTPKYPLLVSHFYEGALEAEIDAVGDGVESVGVVIQHVEPAGVHSGDSTMLLPPEDLPRHALEEMIRAAQLLNKNLNIRGPYNIQFLIHNGEPLVIELNLRASRSMPFTSKATGYSLARAAAEASLKGRITSLPPQPLLEEEGFHLVEPRRYYAVKSPQFSWERLRGAYPGLGAEMRSTGEAAALGHTRWEALLKSWLSVKGNRLPRAGSRVLVYDPTGRSKQLMAEAARLLGEAGYRVSTLEGCEPRGGYESVLTLREAVSMVRSGGIGLVFTTGYTPERDYIVRRAAADYSVPLVLDARLARELAQSILSHTSGGLRLEARELSEYWGGEPIGLL